MTAPEENGAALLTSLQDDTVKLIAYTIVSLKRDKERVMDGGKDSLVVTDSMTCEAFQSWILAKYLQQKVSDPNDVSQKVPRGQLIDPDELQYLRVYYVVSHRWPRQPSKFEQREINALRGIRDVLEQPSETG